MIRTKEDYLLKAWNGIATGELEHEQDYFFCGTARCLAGWTIHLEMKDMGLSPELITDSWFSPDCLPEKINDIWEYCLEEFELSSEDGRTLFGMEATLQEQYEVMRLLYGEAAVNPD